MKIEKMVKTKTWKRYTFRYQKKYGGGDRIGNQSVTCPDCDGIALNDLMKSLPEGTIITTTVEITEEIVEWKYVIDVEKKKQQENLKILTYVKDALR